MHDLALARTFAQEIMAMTNLKQALRSLSFQGIFILYNDKPCSYAEGSETVEGVGENLRLSSKQETETKLPHTRKVRHVSFDQHRETVLNDPSC